jgi:hypothetical protein
MPVPIVPLLGLAGAKLDILDHPGAQGKQMHDANIVAIMRHYAIPYLLTHNASDFGRYAPWVKVLPLVP